MLVIFAKKYVCDFDEILPFITEGKKVVQILDIGEYNFVGRLIDINNYDNIVAEYWANRQIMWPELYCDIQLFENGKTQPLIPKGDYHIALIDRLITNLDDE